MNKTIYILLAFSAFYRTNFAMDNAKQENNEQNIRAEIVRCSILPNTFKATLLPNKAPYFPADANHVYFTYRTANKLIPSTPQEQYQQLAPCEPKNLQLGDFIFLAKEEDPKVIIASFIYFQNLYGLMVGNPNPELKPSDIIKYDANGSFIFSIKDNLKPLASIEQGEIVGNWVVYGGTYFTQGKM